MHRPLKPEQWAEVDAHILAHRILPAIICISQSAGVGVRDAMEIHLSRYNELRTQRPTDFNCTDEEYWQDVYS